MAKIDIEGHELDAFEGFGDAINATKVLQFEFGGCNIDTRTFFKTFGISLEIGILIFIELRLWGLKRLKNTTSIMSFIQQPITSQ